MHFIDMLPKGLVVRSQPSENHLYNGQALLSFYLSLPTSASALSLETKSS